jgi:hypothetical protein
MQTGLSYINESRRVNGIIDTRLSFRPFIAYLEERVKKEITLKSRVYEFALQQFRDEPTCTSDIEIEDVNKFDKLLEIIYTILSPVTADEKKYLWALAAPMSKNIFYGTDAYNDFVNSGNVIELQSTFIYEQEDKIKERLTSFIYQLILDRFYGITSVNIEKIVYSYHDPVTELKKYYELKPDARFIAIKHKASLPKLDFETLNLYTNDGSIQTLKEILPLSDFYLEGFTVITLEDITDEYAIGIIKKTLSEPSSDETMLFEQVKYALKILAGNKDVEFGMMPFLKVNNKLIIDDVECVRSVLINAAKTSDPGMVSFYKAAENYIEHPVAHVYPVITAHDESTRPHLSALKAMGIKSYAALPVFYNDHVVGMLEVFSYKEILHYQYILSRLTYAIPLIAQLLQHGIELFNQKIDHVIKEKFTSLQSSVQWKFNEIAHQYLRLSNFEENDATIGTVIFENVYPLFGAIDIRNSTISRNQALSDDVENLLALLGKEKKSICALLPPKNVSEVEAKFDLWYETINAFLKASDSGMLNVFLKNEVVDYLSQLLNDNPAVEAPVNRLKEIIIEDGDEISGNRAGLEQSIQGINSALNSFFQKERKKLSAIYPCYFETFRTDGVEYDLYAGQSMQPAIEFTRKHLEAFRIWQLKSMCYAVRLTDKLIADIPKPLRTTQLIYVNPHSVNISFRNDEQHFDVEGSYNIRYQIVKKRIDKVNIKNTTERLTQPGKIAIVYFNNEDAVEYQQYIKLCRETGLLYDDCEMLELEELQGVSGLKAIRVTVKL